MSSSIRTSTPARSADFRMQIYSDSKAEHKGIAAQESELKKSFSEIPSTSITIHPAPQLVRVKPKQSEPPKTLLKKLPYSLCLKIVEYLKYKDIFHLRLTCSYLHENLSIEHMVKDTKCSPEQAWKKIVMNEYALDYQHYRQKGLSIKSFKNFYIERSIFHHHLRTSSISTFPKLELSVRIETNRCNALDVNHNGIVTLAQEIPTQPLISLWDMRTGSYLAGIIINGVDLFRPITAIRCSGNEIAYGTAEGDIQFLSIEDKILEKGVLEKRSVELVEKPGFNVNQSVSTLALGKDWQAYGTVRGRIIMHQRSSKKTINLRGHQGCVDYLEFMGDGCIASASRSSSCITVWHTQCHEENADWKEENTFPSITLNLNNDLLNFSSHIRCLHWASPDRLYSGDLGGTIRAWNPLKTEQSLNQFKAHQSPISSIQTTQNLILSTGENGRLVLMDENARLIQSSLSSTKQVKIIGSNIVTINSEGNVCLVSMPSKKTVKVAPRFNKKTIAKTLGVVLLVAVIAVTIFFVIQDRDKN